MAADQKELLWAVSAVMEAQAQALMATGEMAINLTELRDRFSPKLRTEFADESILPRSEISLNIRVLY